MTSIAFFCQRQVGHKLFHVPSGIEKNKTACDTFQIQIAIARRRVNNSTRRIISIDPARQYHDFARRLCSALVLVVPHPFHDPVEARAQGAKGGAHLLVDIATLYHSAL